MICFTKCRAGHAVFIICKIDEPQKPDDMLRVRTGEVRRHCDLGIEVDAANWIEPQY